VLPFDYHFSAPREGENHDFQEINVDPVYMPPRSFAAVFGRHSGGFNELFGVGHMM
jgi:hypothetical protein